MGRALSCPQCGAHHELVNPGIALLICEFCHATLYFGDDEAIRIGRQSVLPDSDARLFLHATGTLDGDRFSVAGHVRYAHDRGFWDEWYLQFDSGRIAWLSEDERELSRQVAAVVKDPPAPADLVLRMPITIDGQAYGVREIGRATVVGGEGQLPFAVTPGEQYPYADLATAAGDSVATLEYDDDRARCFVGVPLAHEDLVITSDRGPRDTSAPAGQNITCTDCGGALETFPDRHVATLVCIYCGAQLDLSAGQARVLGRNSEGIDPSRVFCFAIGDGATFDGVHYEVCGRLLYNYPGGYTAREYLLFAPDAGYLWLGEESGHFVLNKATEAAPPISPFRMRVRGGVSIGGRRLRLFEKTTATLAYVDGALPWVAKVGDRFEEATLVAPPHIFAVERAIDGDEIECFAGRYITAKNVRAALDREVRDRDVRFRKTEGVHPAQPFFFSRFSRAFFAVAILLVIVNALLVLWSFSVAGQQVFARTMTFEEAKAGVTTDPFTLPEETIVRVQAHANMNNAWVVPQVAFVDDQDNVVAETWLEVSYFTGTDSEGHWTEGDLTNDVLMKAPDPGTYRLLIQASGEASTQWRPSYLQSVTITVYAGGIPARYFLAALIVPGVACLIITLRWFAHNQKRWDA